ncbi:MAG TPA: hypothetical protein VFG79_09850 [Solirubrobacter sp.]|nr:hypothetical protein [Solirubrobacter sp.]
MRRLAAAIIVLALAGIAVLVFWGDTTAGQGAAVAVLGVGCVLAVSGVFWAVGRSEDEERERLAAPKPPPTPEEPEDPHPRPALTKRRPLPPRRPS